MTENKKTAPQQVQHRWKTWLHKPGLAIAVLLAAAALMGLALVGRSGVGLDERIELRTLNVNIRAYVELLTGENSPQAQAISEEQISTWHDRDYGQARFYPVWPLMQALKQSGRVQAAGNVFHYYIHLLFLLGLFALYSIVTRLTRSRPAGLLAAGLLLVNPRFYAESFYNSKDLTLLSLCLVVLWLGLRFIQQNDWASCVWFGLAGAVTTNSRIIGLAVFGLCGIVYLVDRIVHRQWSMRCFWRGAAAVATLVVVFFLLTPACWSGFFQYWKELIAGTANFDPNRWNGWVLYRGAVYNPVENPIPWHYIPWMMAITTPLLILALAALWPVLCILRNKADKQKWLSTENLFCLMLGVMFAAPVGYAMLARPNLYNGWRHFYFVYSPVVILAAISVLWLWRSRKKWLRWGLATVLAVHFVYYAGFIAANRPNEFAYFNMLAGPHPEERYDADYWDIGLLTAMDRLHETDPQVRGTARTPYYLSSWHMVRDLLGLEQDGAEYSHWENRWRPRYVLDNVSYTKINDLHPLWDVEDPEVHKWCDQMAQQEPLFEIKSGRTVLWRVYENPQWVG